MLVDTDDNSMDIDIYVQETVVIYCVGILKIKYKNTAHDWYYIIFFIFSLLSC